MAFCLLHRHYIKLGQQLLGVLLCNYARWRRCSRRGLLVTFPLCMYHTGHVMCHISRSLHTWTYRSWIYVWWSPESDLFVKRARAKAKVSPKLFLPNCWLVSWRWRFCDLWNNITFSHSSAREKELQTSHIFSSYPIDKKIGLRTLLTWCRLCPLLIAPAAVQNPPKWNMHSVMTPDVFGAVHPAPAIRLNSEEWEWQMPFGRPEIDWTIFMSAVALPPTRTL
jgi:hypothetical protein